MREPLVRSMLAAYLRSRFGCQISGVSSTASEAINLCQAREPTGLILQHPLDVITEDIIRDASRLPNPVPVIVLTERDCSAVPLLAAGAAACVRVYDTLDDFDFAVRAVVEKAPPKCLPKGLLTNRQLAVLRLIVLGHTTKEIADALGVSFKTADHHRTRLMKRMNSHGVAELISKALRGGLVELERSGGIGVSEAPFQASTV